jgi:HSP20 family protein
MRALCAAHENKLTHRKRGIIMLTRWDPFAEINRLQDEFRKMADRNPVPAFTPAINIYEDKEGIHLTAEVPGMKPEEVNVQVENRVLTISGERKLEKEENKDGYHRIERSYGKFARSFTLPDTVDGEKISAAVKDGVLTVLLPKRAAAQSKKINVSQG